MPSKYTRRNPLLIPAFLLLIALLIAIGVLVYGYFHYERENAGLRDALTVDNAALQAQLFDVHVPQKMACAAAKRTQHGKFLSVDLKLFPWKMRHLTQCAPQRSPARKAVFKQRKPCAEADAGGNFHNCGNFYRDRSQIERQYRRCSKINGHGIAFLC